MVSARSLWISLHVSLQPNDRATIRERLAALRFRSFASVRQECREDPGAYVTRPFIYGKFLGFDRGRGNVTSVPVLTSWPAPPEDKAGHRGPARFADAEDRIARSDSSACGNLDFQHFTAVGVTTFPATSRYFSTALRLRSGS